MNKDILNYLLWSISYLNQGQTLQAHTFVEKAMNLLNKEWDKLPEDDNPFALFSSVKGWTVPTESLMYAINEFVSKYREIEQTYPEFGIGDTASDECIVGIIYDKIHYGKYNEVD